MSQIVISGNEGRQKILKGINTVCNAVKVTLGAQGRNVIIQRPNGSDATKDGVTVVKSIFLKDNVENIGAGMVKEVANTTVENSGDGTTTASILLQAIIHLGIEEIEKGTNPIKLVRGIEFAVAKVVEYIKSVSRPIDTEVMDEIRQIASISANNDGYIGGLIGTAIKKIGKDGIFHLQESNTHETTVYSVDGMQIERGYNSPYFVTDSEKMECVLEKVYILMFDRKISNIKNLVNIMQKIANTPGASLLVVAEDVDGEAISTLVANKQRGALRVCAIKAPGFGDRRIDMMNDMAILTGGQLISEDKGYQLENVELDLLGRAEKVIINKNTTTIISGRGKKEEINLRIKEIDAEAARAKKPTEIDALKSRSARLRNGVAIMSIGGVTEYEIKHKKDRIDDALKATKAAIAEGYVAGGATTYLHAIKIDCKSITEDKDEQAGIDLIKAALRIPFNQILINGGQNPDEFFDHIMAAKYGLGYNIRINKLEDMFAAGIIDPAKVLRVSLENAASVACIFLTTECVIADENVQPMPMVIG